MKGGSLLIASIVLSGQLSAEVDLLSADEWSFDAVSTMRSENPSWWDPLKTTLIQNYSQSTDETLLNRSTLRLQYERSILTDWYLNIDLSATRYASADAQNSEQDGSTIRGKWQQGWLQYSHGECLIQLGRQNLLWGEVEGTFAVDIVTPFDYSEPLLTDYASLRRAQDMFTLACFGNQWQMGLFYIPTAGLDRFTLQDDPPELPNRGSEFGGQLKRNWEGGDLSIMVARLYSNTPVLVLRDQQRQWQLPQFNFIGLSGTVVFSSVLFKWDLGYQSEQKVAMRSESSRYLDIALGLEYLSATQHNLNAGVWVKSELDNDNSSSQSSPIYTLGWSKTAINEQLRMSLLLNHANEPDLKLVSLMAQWQWSDPLQFSVAMTWADLGAGSEQLPMVQAERVMNLKVQYIF